MSSQERVPSQALETIQEQLVEAEKEEKDDKQELYANEAFMISHQLLVRFITAFSTEDLTDDKVAPILFAVKKASWSDVIGFFCSSSTVQTMHCAAHGATNCIAGVDGASVFFTRTYCKCSLQHTVL